MLLRRRDGVKAAQAVAPPPAATTLAGRWVVRGGCLLLIVFGTGVFLAGLELMITAVALPSILADLVAANGTSAWVELRKASWIINAYLLVYILTMPLAGRLADLWGTRRLFIVRARGVHGRVARSPASPRTSTS